MRHLQASNAAGGADVLVSEMLPQLLPLFTCTAAQRKLYGCSVPAAPRAKSGASMPLSSGDVMGQSMHQRMHQALELASHSSSGKQSQTIIIQNICRMQAAAKAALLR